MYDGPVRRSIVLIALVLGACGGRAPEGASSEAGASESTSSGSTSEPTTTSESSESETSEGEDETADPLDPFALPDCDYLELPLPDSLDGASAVTADFDADGGTDLAVLRSGNPAQLQLWWGAGDGTLTPEPAIELDWSGRLELGDFNGDARPDLIVFDAGSEFDLRVLLNLGGGSFDEAIASHVDSLFYTFRVADIDGDGSDDISFGGFHSVPVRAALSAGGSFTVSWELALLACYATGSDWADFDDDGQLDIAIVGGCNAGIEEPIVSTWLGAGADFLQIPEAGVSLGDGPRLFAADFDGDGLDDVATSATWHVATLSLLRGQGDGRFAEREDLALPGTMSLVAKTDANLDEIADVIVGDAWGTALYRGSPAGFVGCRLDEGRFRAVANFDADPEPEILTALDGAWTLLDAP